ncbi:hypothetical protein CY34DRAFT_13149 [Suillus luteus UH-Slu-Lm8-n1]|uniref:Protein kinase domain-containing protein n=1 Tax=Suillus luteus UH-Slu-Lm8-n1 TaxID=930992 RepID=A0A0D0AHC6_9AGAM|nr:hypothetical protein CY34DRAFT_13149 [Suillus luteus UH-Slu-Lm8-n1]
MDATRLSDGLYVSLKVIKKSEHLHEAEIGRYFVKVELASDPKNHCVPFLDVFSVPGEDDTQIIVVKMLRQLFEGLLFMHKHHVAHYDYMWMNIMTDAKDIYVEPYHPAKPHMKRDFSGNASHRTRTQRPPKYYIIDFGLSRQYDANDENPLEYPVLGGDKTVPEFQNDMDVALNPFPTDVYYLGNTIREQFLNFLKPLVDDMMQDDPSKRPTMEQAVERFDSIKQRLCTWKLRSRVTTRDEGHFEHVYYGAAHWRRRIGFIVFRVSALPPAPRQVPPDFFDNVQDRDPVCYHHSPAVLPTFIFQSSTTGCLHPDFSSHTQPFRMCNTMTSNKSRSKTRMERKVAEAAERERRMAQKEFDAFGAERERKPGALSPSEVTYSVLDMLRNGYHPGMVHSATLLLVKMARFWNRIIDATRMSDGLHLSLKVVNKSEFPHEVVIGQYFMMEQSAPHPQNHCVPFLDVLQVPDESDKEIIVMPLLLDFTRPRFDTFGEVVECLRQLFEGLLSMHSNHVAHRDCMSRNIMMDAKDLCVEPYHLVVPRMKCDYSSCARHYTRTQRPFGLSRRYNAQEDNPLEYPIFGGDKSDCFGWSPIITIKTKKGFEFLKPLVDDMVQNDPKSRPTMHVVVERFDLIQKQISAWKLRSRVRARDEGLFETLYRGATHWRRRKGFTVKHAQAIPRLQE